MRLEKVLVVGVKAVGAVASRPTHGLDATADDEVLVPGQHTHRREGDGLLSRPAEPIQRDAGNRNRPAGIEHRHAPDVMCMVAGVGAVAGHDIVNITGVEADAFLQTVQDLPEHLLGMQVRQTALPLLADSARRPHCVDDPCFTFGHVCTSEP